MIMVWFVGIDRFGLFHSDDQDHFVRTTFQDHLGCFFYIYISNHHKSSSLYSNGASSFIKHSQTETSVVPNNIQQIQYMPKLLKRFEPGIAFKLDGREISTKSLEKNPGKKDNVGMVI